MESGRRRFRDILGASGISARQCRARRGDIDLQREIRNCRFDLGRSGIFPVGGRAPIETRHVQSGPQRNMNSFSEERSSPTPNERLVVTVRHCSRSSISIGSPSSSRKGKGDASSHRLELGRKRFLTNARRNRTPRDFETRSRHRNSKHRCHHSHPNPCAPLVGKNSCGPRERGSEKRKKSLPNVCAPNKTRGQSHTTKLEKVLTL